MEARLFEEGTVPEWTTPEWYSGREAAPHLEQEGHRERLLLTAEMAREARIEGAQSLVDLGSGDGGLLSLLMTSFMRIKGYDLQRSNVQAAQERCVHVIYHDVVRGDFDSADVYVMSEMLEHLIDPHDFLRRVADKKPMFIIASSPYTETAESHYEFHTWAWDLNGYAEMIERAGFEIVRRDLAWISQVVLARRVP